MIRFVCPFRAEHATGCGAGSVEWTIGFSSRAADGYTTRLPYSLRAARSLLVRLSVRVERPFFSMMAGLSLIGPVSP